MSFWRPARYTVRLISLLTHNNLLKVWFQRPGMRLGLLRSCDFNFRASYLHFDLCCLLQAISVGSVRRKARRDANAKPIANWSCRCNSTLYFYLRENGIISRTGKSAPFVLAKHCFNILRDHDGIVVAYNSNRSLARMCRALCTHFHTVT